MHACPNCRSEQVRPVIYSADAAWREGLESWRRPEGEPKKLDLVSPNWSCDACGHAWPDEERLETCRKIRAWADHVGPAIDSRPDPAP